MPWKHTEGLPTLRDGQRACIQDFQTCTTFAQQTGPRTKSFRGKFSTPLFFALMGMTLNLSGNKIIGEIWTKTRISTPMPPFWQGMVQIQPSNLTLDPKV